MAAAGLQIFNQHEIFYKSNVGEVDKYVEGAGASRVFCLGEIHGNSQVQMENGAFISRLAQVYKIALFVEGKAHEVSEEAQIFFKEYLQIDPSITGNVSIFGWDIDSEKDPTWLRFTELSKTQEEVDEQTRACERQLCLEIDQLVHTHLDAATRPYLELLEEVLSSNFDKKIFFQEQLKILVRKQIDLIEQQQLCSREMYPRRTAAMCNTLDKITSLLGTMDLFVIVAGAGHFRLNHEGDENFELYSFYEKLSASPAMVLLPHGLLRQDKIRQPSKRMPWEPPAAKAASFG